MYRLDNSWAPSHMVSVVGCGGTGSFVAEGLCRILPSHQILLIDCDRIEERNLERSNYTTSDISEFKSEVLARRLSAKYRRAIAYSTLPVGMVDLPRGLVIGCVDNGPARLQIAHQISPPSWWIDSGNGRNYGQILIGNLKLDNLRFCFKGDICFGLPLPTLQRPDLLTEEKRRHDCNEAVALNEQGPTINQIMASLVLEVVRLFFDGTCKWMQLYVDLDAGTLYPVMSSPESVSGITGVKIKRLIVPKGGEKDGA